MITHRRILFLLLLYQIFQVPCTFACQYNVRETGFVDLGNSPYLFVGYVNDHTSDVIKSHFNQISQEMLSETNIEFKIINIDRQKTHRALKYIDQWQINSFPAAVLVSPDSQSLPVNILNPKQKFEQSLRAAINEIVSSPFRDQILENTIKNYAAVLLIAGTNSEENKRAYKTATAVIDHIKKKMNILPKAIKYPPALIVLEYASSPEEKILLWSLGIDINALNGPYVAIIYGRGRWLGPLFTASEINKNYLSEILLVIGADCECGLDQEWLQGTMLPARWDKNKQTRIAKNLGFDPENPLIKREMSRIIRLGSLYQRVSNESQNSLDQSDSQSNDQLNSSSKHDQDLSDVAVTDSLSREIDEEPFFKKSFYITAISLLLIFITGMVIVIRKARK